ncbi:serine hydrolase [Fusibacter sp. JL298sf-3]
MHSFKKCFSVFLATALIAGGSLTAFAQENGAEQPLRTVVEALGGKTEWDGKTKEITCTFESGTYIWSYEDQKLYKDGVEMPESYTIALRDNVSYISEPFARDVFNANVAFVESGIEASVIPQSLEMALTNAEEETKKALLEYLAFESLYGNLSGQVLISKDDRVLVHRAYGESSLKTGEKASVLDTYAIGSMTKQMTALAVIQLEEKGMLDFQDTVDKYIPNAPYGDKITLHQLLTHTSGLYNYTESFEYETVEDIYKAAAEKPLLFEPGTNWSYCNTGYYLLGKVVESLTDKTLYGYLNEMVYVPNVMLDTYPAYDGDTKNMTTLGSLHGDVETSEVLDKMLLNIAEGAGYIASSTEDILKWNEALYNATLISDTSLAVMKGQEPVSPYNYGYGLFFVETPYGLEVGHGGNTVGYTSLNTYYEDMDTHVLILSNKGYANLEGIKNNLIKILNGEAVEMEKDTVIDLEASALKAFEGVYNIPDILKIEIFVEDGVLMLQGENQGAVPLNAVGEKTFVNKDVDIKIDFDQSENPTYFILYQAGAELKAEKLTK